LIVGVAVVQFGDGLAGNDGKLNGRPVEFR